MLIDSGYKRVCTMQGGITEWVHVGYPVAVDHKFWAAKYPKVVSKRIYNGLITILFIC